MNVAEVEAAIKRVIRANRPAFIQIGSSLPKLLELGAVTGVAEHYKSEGYSIQLFHPRGKRAFVVKTSTRGYPWNFSRIVAKGEDDAIEIHMNVMVRSAHDEGIYCVDVGIVRPGIIPVTPPAEKWACLKNKDLITFAEVKKLVIYPMLLAQFIGIVHEIKPKFLRGRGKLLDSHLSPILIALGYYSGNSKAIVDAYEQRRISVTIAENYDMRLALVRGGSASSPFEDITDEFLELPPAAPSP